MANYNGCTQKQIEALEPLEQEAKRLKKRKDYLQKRLAFEHFIGFEENIELHEEMKELDEAYAEISAKITKIYGAKAEMVKHMKKAIEEINAVNAIRDKWGFVVEGQ